jgi:Tol biopolymer transport system component
VRRIDDLLPKIYFIVDFWRCLGIILLATLLNSCTPTNIQSLYSPLNSRYNDEQPALSGDGRWLAMVSNRNGRREILLYDLQQQTFVDLPGMYPKEAIADSPSLSRTGRYIVYISSIQGRPDLFLYDRAINRTQLLTQGYRSWLRNPKISPDGRYIVFETARRGQWDVEVLDLGPNLELDILDGTPVN